MQKLINNILAPIRAGKQSMIVAERAVRMANHFHCGLHLLYTETTGLVPIFGAQMYEWLPFLAAGAMAMSSVSVVGNSLLLGRYRPRFAVLKPEKEQINSGKEIEDPSIHGMFKDPVCKMLVDEKTAKHVSEVTEKKVYLCSAACKSRFEANPKKYGY